MLQGVLNDRRVAMTKGLPKSNMDMMDRLIEAEDALGGSQSELVSSLGLLGDATFSARPRNAHVPGTSPDGVLFTGPP